MRQFVLTAAKREAVPLLVGLIGPSGSGKTFSALRLASGIRSVVGGEIHVIDTESRRALYYADRFKFKHIDFRAPFGSLDYLAAVEHCAKDSAKVIVIDSMSHEHEGPGGVLEQHAEAVQRLSGGDPRKADRVTMLAWSGPKQARRRLLNGLVQSGVSLIVCFRAKEKLRLVRGGQPQPLGWMPIGGEEFAYEMTACCFLPPASGGVPQWDFGDEARGSASLAKLPEPFRDLFASRRPLSEEHGAGMARWAAGSGTPGATAAPSPADRPMAAPRKVDSLSEPERVGVAEPQAKASEPEPVAAPAAAPEAKSETPGEPEDPADWDGPSREGHVKALEGVRKTVERLKDSERRSKGLARIDAALGLESAFERSAAVAALLATAAKIRQEDLT